MDRPRQPQSPKKPYRAPELSFYGTVKEITRGTTGPTHDGGGGGSHVCWIAEALYGIDAAETLLVRAWLNERYTRRVRWAVIVVPLYRRFGQAVAEHVARRSTLRALFRRLFDHAVRRAHDDYASLLTARFSAAMS